MQIKYKENKLNFLKSQTKNKMVIQGDSSFLFFIF